MCNWRTSEINYNDWVFIKQLFIVERLENYMFARAINFNLGK